MTTTDELIERVAEAIYRTSGGMDDEDYQQVMGEPRRTWKTDKPWDSDPEHELCEWERDEYRLQAKAALEVLKGIGGGA